MFEFNGPPTTRNALTCTNAARMFEFGGMVFDFLTLTTHQDCSFVLPPLNVHAASRCVTWVFEFLGLRSNFSGSVRISQGLFEFL